MNRHDKHRQLVPVLEATSHLQATELIVEKGYVLSLGPRGGQHLQRDYAGTVQSFVELEALLRQSRAGQKIKFTVWRAGQLGVIDVILQPMPTARE